MYTSSYKKSVVRGGALSPRAQMLYRLCNERMG
nr:MAG TPA: hypothetical protein [Inoviridae sp.]